MKKKTIKIRYIKSGKIPYDYCMQKKTIFGTWRDIGYHIGACTGDSIWYPYTNSSKEELLKEVLEHHYGIDRRFTSIIEYPEIKHY